MKLGDNKPRKGVIKMGRTRNRRKKNRDYKRYHKRDKYGRNRKNNYGIKKLFHVFLSLLLILFVPHFENPIQIWKDEDEKVHITQPVDDDEEDNEEEEEVGKDIPETEQDVKVDTDSPRFVLDGRWNAGFTRTWYDVDVEGGVIASYGLYWNDEDMRVQDNYIQYHDEQYGWVNVYALNVDQMKEYGTVVTSTALGSIIEVRLPNSSTTHYGIVLDVCGACAKAKKIDVWVKNQYEAVKNGTHIDGEVEFRFRRFGFDGEPIVYKE